MNKNTLYIIIFGLIILVLNPCSSSHKNISKTSEVKTEVRSNIKPSFYTKPKNIITFEKIYIKDTVYIVDTTFITDTVFIYDDYFTHYNYKDTILNDLRALIIIDDTIYRNKLYSRKSNITWHKQKPKINFYVGTEIEIRKDEYVVSVNGLISYKKNMVGAGINNKKEYLIKYYRNFGK